MKEMHRLMVTSDTYKLASEADPAVMAANLKVDPAGHLSLALPRCSGWKPSRSGIRSSRRRQPGPDGRRPVLQHRRRRTSQRWRRPRDGRRSSRDQPPRRLHDRGFSTSSEVMPNFLQAFDVDDGRAPCPMRTQTVTAPQALFMMNSEEVESASAKLAARLQKESRRRSAERRWTSATG